MFLPLHRLVSANLIFQAFVMSSRMASTDYATAMVYTPLDNITQNLQI